MKELLLVSIGFSPNIGGIETHFDNLVDILDKKGWKVWILTYKPITTKVGAFLYERQGKRITIFRIPWFGKLFYKLVNTPALEFIYLFPGLFIALPIFLILKGRKVRLIDSHGLTAGFVSVFWGKIFGKRVVVSTHSIYHFSKKGLYRTFAKWIFTNANYSMGLSKQAAKEIKSLGINESKVGTFTYWVDLDKFIPIKNAKKKLGWEDKFVVLFIGRLIPEKGVLELLEAAKTWNKNIYLTIAGAGPLEEKVRKESKTNRNVLFLGKIENEKLPPYYSSADLVIVPSTHEEGFGRVILESLACGTPVIGAKRGAIPEAMNETVGKFIDVSPKTIKAVVEDFYSSPSELKKLAENARAFAEKRYSEKNVEKIIKIYNE